MTINNEKPNIDLKNFFPIAKNYVLHYFAKSSKSPSTIYYYEPEAKGAYSISNEGMAVMKPISYDITYWASEAEPKKFKIYKWL